MAKKIEEPPKGKVQIMFKVHGKDWSDDSQGAEFAIKHMKFPDGEKEILVDDVAGVAYKPIDMNSWCYQKDESLNEIKDPYDKVCILKLRTIIYVRLNPDWITETIQKNGYKEYKSRSDLSKWQKELQILPKDKKLDILEKFMRYRLLVSVENEFQVSIFFIEKWLREVLEILNIEMTTPPQVQRWIRTFKRKYNIRTSMHEEKIKDGLWVKNKTLAITKK